jgi:hypothetical protein
LAPVLSVSIPSWLEEHDPDSFGILFYARSGAFANLVEAGCSGTPLIYLYTYIYIYIYIFKPSFNLLLSVSIGLVIWFQCFKIPWDAHWVIVYIGQFFENYLSSPHFLATFFPRLRLCNNFWQKMGLAIFWVISSLANLVTLVLQLCKLWHPFFRC